MRPADIVIDYYTAFYAIDRYCYGNSQPLILPIAASPRWCQIIKSAAITYIASRHYELPQ